MAQGSGSSEDRLRYAEVGSPMRRFYDAHMKGNPRAFVNGVAEARRRIIEEPKTLAFGTAVLDDNLISLDIEERTRSSHGIIFGKGSELTEMFNYQLRRMDENGLLFKIFHVSLIFSSVYMGENWERN